MLRVGRERIWLPIDLPIPCTSKLHGWNQRFGHDGVSTHGPRRSGNLASIFSVLEAQRPSWFLRVRSPQKHGAEPRLSTPNGVTVTVRMKAVMGQAIRDSDRR